MTVTRITDFTPWDLRNEFTDWETAYLWFGFEPNYSGKYTDHPSNVIGLRAALSEAVQRGELPSRTEDDSGRRVYHDKWGRERGVYVFAPATTWYSRQALRQWAERKGQRPLFLFPEDRTPVHADIEAVRQLQSETGKEAATQQHADKNRWYLQAEKTARDLWESGSTLTHNKMATELLKGAPPKTSRTTLLTHLKTVLRELGKGELILGSKKKS